MQQDFPNPYPKPSFQFPVPPPTVDPDASPTRSFTIACQWLPYIRGALTQLVLQATWQTSDPGVLYLTQQRAQTLISMFDECPSAELPFACPYDFRVLSVSSWSVEASYGDLTPPPIGHFTPLFGFVPDAKFEPGGNDTWTAVYISRVYASAFNVHTVQMTYDLSKGSNYAGEYDANNALSIALFNGGSVVAFAAQLGSALVDGTFQTFTNDFGGAVGDEIRLFLLVGVDGPGSTGGSGSGRIQQAQVFGTASVPPSCD